MPPPRNGARRASDPAAAMVFAHTDSVVFEALQAASVAAAERLAGFRHDSQHIRDEIAALANRVRLLATRSRGSIAEPLGLVFSRHLIDTLRAELVERLVQTPNVDAEELVAVLSAMDRLAAQADHPNPGEFGERLVSSEALRAVVEIAHDMRSPLAAILFLVETLRGARSGPVTPIQERQLGLIYSAALGLSGLTSDLLEAGRGNLLADAVAAPFSVREIVDEVCAMVAPMAEEKGLELKRTYAVSDGRMGHAPAIQRVVLNLTINALKHTEAGSVAVGCTELDDRCVEFWVRDTGDGIPDDVLAMLFDGFHPGSEGIRFSAAGLGLAICRSLLERMHSALRVETASGEGTRFSFVLEVPKIDPHEVMFGTGEHEGGNSTA